MVGWHLIFKFEIRIFFFLHLASPTKRFSFTIEYETPTSERHDSVHLEEKTKMPKTSAVWDNFEMSEDKTKAVRQICDHISYHNSTSSLKKFCKYVYSILLV